MPSPVGGGMDDITIQYILVLMHELPLVTNTKSKRLTICKQSLFCGYSLLMLIIVQIIVTCLVVSGTNVRSVNNAELIAQLLTKGSSAI